MMPLCSLWKGTFVWRIHSPTAWQWSFEKQSFHLGMKRIPGGCCHKYMDGSSQYFLQGTLSTGERGEGSGRML